MTTAAPQQLASLPTRKTPPSLSLNTMKTLIYGPAKIGKSTLASQLDPEHTIFLATEPGLGALDVYEREIRSWSEFLDAGRALATEDHPFKVVVVDTVDELTRMCADYVLNELNAREKSPKKGYLHPSDWEYGKAWEGETEEARLRLAKLCSLGMGVVFVSHAKESTDKDRTGAEVTKYAPNIGHKGVRKWLMGFVDLITLARVEGDGRVLRTRPTELYEAGGRIELPDPLPLDAKALRKAIAEATGK